jgi:hypothetical protein
MGSQVSANHNIYIRFNDANCLIDFSVSHPLSHPPTNLSSCVRRSLTTATGKENGAEPFALPGLLLVVMACICAHVGLRVTLLPWGQLVLSSRAC